MRYLVLLPLTLLVLAGALSTQTGPTPGAPNATPAVATQDTSGSARAAQDMAAPGDTLPEYILSPSYVGEVEFPHQMHVDDLEIACDECHHETNAAAIRMPHKDYFKDFWIDCSICHHPSGKVVMEAQACGNCHPSQPHDIADETLSAKVVIHEKCWECHDAGTGADASESCGECHAGERRQF